MKSNSPTDQLTRDQPVLVERLLQEESKSMAIVGGVIGPDPKWIEVPLPEEWGQPESVPEEPAPEPAREPAKGPDKEPVPS
jgi:hypothetical protein